MKFKPNILLLIIVVLIGSAIYRNFDLQTLKFRPFWQSMLYIATFLIAVYLLIKHRKG